MHGRDDFDQLLRWGERLRLYGEVQGVYYEQLREQGFDSEQAFQLVREWTSRTLGWTVDDQPVVPAHADFFRQLAEVAADPSVAPDGEDYLIAPEPPAQPAGPPPGMVHELRPRKRRPRVQDDAHEGEDAGEDDARIDDAA